MWNHSTYYEELFTFPNLYTKNPSKKIWIMIEIYIFFSWIFSSMFFMSISYFIKDRGMWRAKKAQQMRDLWTHKDSDDFLSYMKFEYKNFCMGGCFFLFNLLLIKWFTGGYGGKVDIMMNSLNYYKDVKHTWWLMLIFILILVANRVVYFVFMHRLHSSNGLNKMIGPRELPTMYALNISFLLIGIVIYTVEIIRGNFDPFLYIWCFAELMNSFFLIPYYYVISQTIY